MAHRDISLRCSVWSLSGHSGHRVSRSNHARFMIRALVCFRAERPIVEAEMFLTFFLWRVWQRCPLITVG